MQAPITMLSNPFSPGEDVFIPAGTEYVISSEHDGVRETTEDMYARITKAAEASAGEGKCFEARIGVDVNGWAIVLNEELIRLNGHNPKFVTRIFTR